MVVDHAIEIAALLGFCVEGIELIVLPGGELQL